MRRFVQLITVLLLASTSLQGCVAPTTTSARYRVLSSSMMESVKTDMTQAEVWHILGEPWNTTVYPLKPHETYHNWKWRNHQNEGMLFGVVMNADNRVIRTETWRDIHDARNISAPSRN